MPKSDEPAVVLETALDIFRDGIEHGARFVMTNHAIYTWLDQSTLATFSPKIVTDLLIKKIGFNGLVITDDLSRMKAITSGVNPIEAGIQALRAGHHLIMFSHLAPKELVTIVGQLKTAAANDSLLKNRIEQNYEKIKTFKITHRLA